MTTWEECSYLDDTLCRIVQLSPREDKWAKFLWEKFSYPSFDYEACGLRKESDIETASGMRKAFPNFGNNKDEWFMNNFKELTDKSTNVFTGNEGIYEFIERTFNFKIESRREMQFGKIKDLTKTMLQVNLLGSLTTPKNINPLINSLLLQGNSFKEYANLLQTASAMQHLAFYWRSSAHSEKLEKSRKNKLPLPSVNRNSIELGKYITAYPYPGIQLISYVNDVTKDNILFIFTNKQIRRLEITIRAISKAIFYYNITYESCLMFPNIFSSFMSMFIESMTKTKRYSEVARAWDIIFNINLAKMASDITDLSYKLQLEKLYDGKYDKIVSWQMVSQLLEPLSAATRIDLLKLYKVLPAPDFNPSTGFKRMEAIHKKQHSFGEISVEHKQEFPFLDISINEFRTFQKLQLLRRLYRKYQYLPLSLSEKASAYLYENTDSELSNFPRCRPNHLSNEEINLINFTSEADYEELQTNSPNSYVDKACTPQHKFLKDYVCAADYYSEKVFKRNYAAWYINQTNVPTTTEIRSEFLNGEGKNNQMAFFKPEAKKSDPRNFYSATPHQRLCMTEFENNVSRYLTHDIASFQSKDPKERANALSALLGEENLQIRRRLVFISFDLEKFSPCLPKKAKDLSMELWIDFFGQKSMKAVREFYNDTQLHFMHQGLHQTYTVDSVDMEGQNGKVNTCYHEDVMAFTVRLLRRYELINQPAKLAVFIDDGLLALALPLETTNEKIMQIIRMIDCVYSFFWSKNII